MTQILVATESGIVAVAGDGEAPAELRGRPVQAVSRDGELLAVGGERHRSQRLQGGGGDSLGLRHDGGDFLFVRRK